MKKLLSIALVLMLIAVGFFIPVFIEYLQTGLVPKFPTLSTDLLAGFPLLNASWLQGSQSLCPRLPGAEGRKKEAALLADGVDHL